MNSTTCYSLYDDHGNGNENNPRESVYVSTDDQHHSNLVRDQESRPKRFYSHTHFVQVSR